MIEKRTAAGIVADVLIYGILIALVCITLYPIIYIFSTSISDPVLVMKNKIFLWPRGVNIGAYKQVFQTKSIWSSYGVSIFLVIVGTFINLAMNICAAFPLSRRSFAYRRPFMMIIIFTMFFSGGMIPTYLVVDGLHLTDTIWAMIIPTAVGAFNIIIMRSFFESIPEAMEEAVKIDGGTDFTVLFKIFIPLSTPVIAVICLFYAVGHWNGFTQALIYLRDRSLFPLQVVLRELLLQNKVQELVSVESSADMLGATRSIQYATIIVSIVPMMIIYPFLQRYFVKGVMIGAVKG